MAVARHAAKQTTDRPPDPRPRWPTEPIDVARVDFQYNPPADELTLFFDGRPLPSYCDPIDAPEGDVAIMVGMNEDESSTGEIVGVQVLPLLVGAVNSYPGWATLARGSLAGYEEDETVRAAVAAFLVDVAALYERYGVVTET